MSMIDYSKLPNSMETSSGQLAWKPSDLPLIMDYALKNSWIVLGGDVLTYQGKLTYDSWYYNPKPSCSIAQNIEESIETCLGYVSHYSNQNGENFLFSLVLSDTFLAG